MDNVGSDPEARRAQLVHNLRTPLTVIMARAELTQRWADQGLITPGKVAEDLWTIIEAALELREAINAVDAELSRALGVDR
jgi:signal transduction histidine kinase